MAYIVKAQYGRYIINDVSYSSIFVTTGNTIIFDVSHSSNADHPLKISTTKDGTHGVDENGNPGTELDDATAIVNNGVPGEPNAQIMFTPALDGIFYYYCEHHANMGSSITSVQTKFTDLGATAYDAQDGDITNRITKKIYKKDGNNVFQLVASINDSHGNPWEVSNIDITEQASYKIEYNAKGLDNIDASNQPLERYINIITAPGPTLPADYLASQKACDVNADLTGYLYDDDHYVIRYAAVQRSGSFTASAQVYEFYCYGSASSFVTNTPNFTPFYLLQPKTLSLFNTSICVGWASWQYSAQIGGAEMAAFELVYEGTRNSILEHTLDTDIVHNSNTLASSQNYRQYIHPQNCSTSDSLDGYDTNSAASGGRGFIVENNGGLTSHIEALQVTAGTDLEQISIYPIKKSA